MGGGGNEIRGGGNEVGGGGTEMSGGGNEWVGGGGNERVGEGAMRGEGRGQCRAVKSHYTAVSLTVNDQISQSHCYTRKSHCK